MAMSAGSVEVKVGAQTRDFDRGMDSVQSRLGKFSGVVSKIALAGAAGFATAAALAIRAAGNFEQSLNTFQAVSDATGAEMKQVSSLAKKLGSDLTLPATSAKDAAEAMTELAKGGLNVKQSMAAAKGVLQLSAAAQIEVGEAATITARALGMFGLSGREAGRVADVLANAANASTGEISDFALGLQQSGAVAKQWGLSINETTAALMEMADAGIVGSDAGTSLKTMLQSLIPTSDKSAKAMKGLGVDVFDANGVFIGMQPTIAQFQKGLQGLTQEQQAAALKTIFGSDAVRAANVILGQGAAKFAEYTDKTERSGAAADLAAAKMKGFNGAVEGLKSQIETLAIEAGEKLLPAVTRVVAGLNKMVGEFGEAEGAGAKFRVVMDSLGNVWDALLNGIGQVSPRIESAMRGMTAAAKTMGQGMSTSWGQFVAAAVIGAAAFATAAQKVVAAWRAMQLGLVAVNPAMAAMVVLAGLVAGALYTIVTSGEKVSVALKSAEQALRSLKSTSDDAKDANLTLAESQNRLKQAAMDVTTAIKAKQTVVAAEGASSAAAKQAELSVEAAYLARKRAAQDVAEATERVEKTTRAATATSNTAKGAVSALKTEYDGLIAKGPPLQSAIGRIGVAQDKLNDGFSRQTAKKYAADLNELATKADKSAASLAKTDPALSALAAGVAKGARAQANLVTELGKVPPAIDAVASAASIKGASIGANLAAGVAAGVASRAAAVAAEAAGLVNKAYAAASAAAQMHSPSRLFALIGKGMSEGVAQGILGAARSVEKAMYDGIVGQAKKLQGELDRIQAQREAQDRQAAVRSAQAALAAAEKEGKGVAEARRALNRAIEDIEIAANTKQLIRLQTQMEKLKASHEANLEKIAKAIEAKKARFQTAWNKLHDAAVSAFDRTYGSMQTAAEKQLALIERTEAERGRQEELGAAQRQLAAATNDEERTAALERVRQAELAITVAGLRDQAAEERKSLDERIEKKRTSFETALERLRIQLEQEGATQETAHARIMLLYKAFGVDYENAGAAMGASVVRGLQSKLAEANAIKAQLAALNPSGAPVMLAPTVPVVIPPVVVTGPMPTAAEIARAAGGSPIPSDNAYSSGAPSAGSNAQGNAYTRMAEGAVVRGGRGGVRALIGEKSWDEAVVPLRQGMRSQLLGGRSGGPIYLTVVMPNYLGSRREAARELLTEFQRISSGGGALLSRTAGMTV